MLLGGYSVELSVDGNVLKEYSEPADKRPTTTSVSYVLDHKTGQKIESDQTIYAAIDQVDKSYEILFGTKKELINTLQEQQVGVVSFKTKIYVDGQWDHSWRVINKPSKMKKDGFIGDKRKKTPLMFDLTKLEEIDDEKMTNHQDKFGYGAISVYFFNSKDIDKNETTDENSPAPLAVLNLHYRPTQWLLERNILVEESSSEIVDNAQVTKDDNEADQNVQETKKVKPETKKKAKQTRKGKNKTTTETTTTETEEPAGDEPDISEWTGKLDLDDTKASEENQESKKRPRSKKVKKNVEEAKDEVEKRYNLRARK